jgi:delta 1-pyrroline-5-carboxylate dehydrogenase
MLYGLKFSLHKMVTETIESFDTEAEAKNIYLTT